MKSSFLCYSNYVPAWQLSSFQITSSLIPSLIFSLLTSSQDHASHVRSVTVSNALPKWHFDKNKNKKKRARYSLKQAAQFIPALPSSVYPRCWMWRLLGWCSTCPCCEMIHLQVCRPASQSSTQSFSPPLPRWAKAPHLLRLQRRRLFLPHDFASQGCVSLPLNPNQTRFDAIFAPYMSQLYSAGKEKEVLRLLGANHKGKS